MTFHLVAFSPFRRLILIRSGVDSEAAQILLKSLSIRSFNNKVNLIILLLLATFLFSVRRSLYSMDSATIPPFSTDMIMFHICNIIPPRALFVAFL